MSLEEATPERIISLLAHRPRHIINGMIRITEPPPPSSTWRTSPSSSLGDLDILSLELLHSIFARLDFKTLANISRTCLRGTVVVKSLPEYRDIARHAPQALAALGKTRMIRHHSATAVHGALLSVACVSCGHYGPFLFLPTCQRCCSHCLWRNQSLWVVPMSTAKRCFGLSAAGAKSLSMMRSVPGKYYVRHTVSRQRSIGLVCVGTAKKLAIAEKRSEERMRQDLDDRRSAGLSEKEFYLFRFLQKAPLTPPGPNFLFQPTESNVPNDMFCGMASVPFPSLVPGNPAEHGFWCLGCEFFWRRWSPNNTIPDHLSHLLLPGCRAADVVYNVQDISRSRTDFLGHVRQCPGAGELFHEEQAQCGSGGSSLGAGL